VIEMGGSRSALPSHSPLNQFETYPYAAEPTDFEF